jgi:hypothetical protein
MGAVGLRSVQALTTSSKALTVSGVGQGMDGTALALRRRAAICTQAAISKEQPNKLFRAVIP